MSDKRTVSTDALETLGTVPIPDDSGRDAIHLAVEPVVAGEYLLHGAYVQIMDGLAYGCAQVNAVGVVDPFINVPVQMGEKFWLVVLPRTITSLRHVWSHPAFPEESVAKPGLDKLYKESDAWIMAFAERIGQSYDSLMAAADLWLKNGESTYDNDVMYKGHYAEFHEFWQHYQIVTNTVVKPDDQESFFTCSC